MELAIGYLRTIDTQQAAELDSKWFGSRAITKSELDDFIQVAPDRAIAVLSDGVVYGFATFEVVEKGALPRDYIASGEPKLGRMLFIQQFTTAQNYSGDMHIDILLLDALEVIARKINCSVIAEALAVNHPFKKENNIAHDAFGFYTSRGYVPDEENGWAWKQEHMHEILCVLFSRRIEAQI